MKNHCQNLTIGRKGKEMQINTNPLYTVDDFGSLQEFAKLFPDEEIAELDAFGDNYSKNRWNIADKAREYVDDWKLPAMWVYALISSRTDRGKSTVRQACYASRFFHFSGLREKYSHLHYSIFLHASKTGDKHLECLQYASDNQLRRPGELKLLFPTKEPEQTEEQIKAELTIPLWARPISRRIFELDPATKKLAEAVFSTLLSILQDKETNSIDVVKEDAVKLANEPTK